MPDRSEEGQWQGKTIPSEIAELSTDSHQELGEANKCFVFDRFTASAYHCMRAIEHMFPHLAIALNELGADCDPKLHKWHDWGRVLNTLDVQMEKMYDTPRSKRDQHRVKRLSEMISYMRAVKDAWRNDLGHARASYSEDMAFDILTQTTGLIKHIALLKSES